MKEFSLEEYLKNPNREVVTRDGRKVRIICTDFDNPNYPVIGEIKGNKWPCSFTTNGLLINGDEHPKDLFFAPEKHEGWVNIIRNEVYNEAYCGKVYASKEEAESKANNATIATVKIEWEE